jgi:GNAT superfamily N-acetyltransferase
MSLEITTLQEKHLEDAAILASRRYRALRERVPIMPSRYEEPDVILPMLDRLVRKSPGVVALEGSRLVGFLSALTIPMLLGKRCAYSPEWANSVELKEGRRPYDEMYARLSAQWVADGCMMHAVTCLANDRPGIEGWQWLGFGLAGVDGIRALKPVEGTTAQVEVRQAGRGDVSTVSFFVEALEQHMTSAPIFWIHDIGDCKEWLNDPAKAVWLAHAGQEAIGCMTIGPANSDACAIIQDDRTASITMAFTRESVRNKGVAMALLNHSLEWARSQGYERCAVDFETMNLLASRFWCKWFEPVCYSLIRSIDERVASASDEQLRRK